MSDGTPRHDRTGRAPAEEDLADRDPPGGGDRRADDDGTDDDQGAGEAADPGARDRLIERWGGRSWPRRAAPFVLVGGLALALGMLRRDAPREQEITVRLEGARGQVTGVEMQVVDEAGEPAASTRWGFAPGQAPGSVHGQARVKPGPWRVRVRVDGGEPVHLERTLRLEGEPVSVTVKLPT